MSCGNCLSALLQQLLPSPANPLRPYQILVWVTLTAEESLGADPPLFPTILDTGHGHNFSIQESQLIRWAQCRPEGLPKRGVILVNREQVPLVAAHIWIHRNRPGTSEHLARPFLLNLPEGISVYPGDAVNAPRLPLLGLRALMRNRLKLTIGRYGRFFATGRLINPGGEKGNIQSTDVDPG